MTVKIRGSQNGNVALASSVTAHARRYLSIFKNDPAYNLYYTDTDSIFIDAPLPEKLVSDGLGTFKLEYVFKDVVFLAPKVYACKTQDGTLISKIKGYTEKDKVTLNDMEQLLTKGNYKNLQHTKWFRNMTQSAITITSSLYNLVQTQNKRTIIFNDKDQSSFTVRLN